jgi:2-dehydro-3-deoxygluconokinase
MTKKWTAKEKKAEHLLLVGEPLIQFSQDKEKVPSKWRDSFAGDVWPNTAFYTKDVVEAFGDTKTKLSVFGGIGMDDDSRALKDMVNQKGINTDLVRIHPDRGLGSITNDLYLERQGKEGESRILDRENTASRKVFKGLDQSEMEKLLVDKTSLYVSGTILGAAENRGKVIELMRLAKQKGMRVFFSTNMRPQVWAFEGKDEPRKFSSPHEKAGYYMDEAMKYADVVFASQDDEIKMHPDCINPAKAAERIHTIAPNVKEILVTDGGKPGILHCYDDKKKRIVDTEFAPPPNIRVVAGVGAGDSFAGTYVAARFNGVAPKESAQMAAKVGSYVVQFDGAYPRATDLIPYKDIINTTHQRGQARQSAL